MPSSLKWLDHDPEARERSLRILALFQEKETRDELGLGAVRDALADLLFPGTTTIQTRLRYMLFVPWIYSQLEGQRTPASEFPGKARKLEMRLKEALLAGGETEGVFGRVAGEGLRRLPSSVYWAGLGSWGIRRIDASQDEYIHSLDLLHRRRAESRGSTDTDEARFDGGTVSWHPKLPRTPEDFLDRTGFALTQEESSFLLDCLVTNHRDSLFAHLALNCAPCDSAYAWHHPDLATFPSAHRELLHQARLFSEVMHGAAIVYNLSLARLAERRDREELLAEEMGRWVRSLDGPALNSWSLDQLWTLTGGTSHTIGLRTRSFIHDWVEVVRSDAAGLIDNRTACNLVEQREKSLKGSRSRFRNVRAREQWNGEAGMRRMDFRWGTAKSFLDDLHDGLKRRPHAQS